MFRIRMDTEQVRSLSAALRQNADTMDAHIDTLQVSLNTAEWQSNARDEFVSDFHLVYQNSKALADLLRLMAHALERKVEQWEEIANIFLGPFPFLGGIWSSVLDNLGILRDRITGILKGINWPSIGGTVLPIATILPIFADRKIFEKIKPGWDWNKPRWWPGKPDEEPKIIHPIYRLTPEKYDENYIVPSDWSEKFADEAELEKMIVDLEKELADRKKNIPFYDPYSDIEGMNLRKRLIELKEQYLKVKESINAGIATGETPSNLKSNLAGCTNYVAGKRNVEEFYKWGKMNATYWDDNAIEAGFDVGSRPVKGSIMVFEADKGLDNGIMNVNNDAGHVAFVESVTNVDGGYMVNISHGGVKRNSGGEAVYGTYRELKPISIFVPYESDAVSFIYDKNL